MVAAEIPFEELRSQALAIGWDDIGVTPAKIPEADIDSYRSWLAKGYQGDLAYMENQMRIDPEQLFPGARNAIMFVTYYKQEKISFRNDAGIVASYARGRDYHKLHRRRLKKFIAWLEERSGQRGIARGFSDSAPILEKALAVQAGLGWFGKNTLLIHRRFGTFILLSGLLTNLAFSYAAVHMRLPRCGTCTRCLDACPTQAFVSPYILDGSKCLSYHLIESKKSVPAEIAEKNPGYIFGCDVCQDVCPHNVRKPISKLEEFSPEVGVGEAISPLEMENLEKDPTLLYGTPLQRRGVPGLKNTLLSLNLISK